MGQLTLDQAAAVAVSLPVAAIRPGTVVENDRKDFDQAEIEQLADSMRTHGLAQPILVRPVDGLYEIVAGERRWRSAVLLGWQTIPAIVRELDDEQAAAIMLLENVHRANLSPLEEARAYHRRMERFGWSVAQVAEHAQVNEQRVARRLLLLSLPLDTQKLVASGALPLGHAEMLTQLDHNRQAIALRVFTGGRAPTLREWSRIVGELLAQQQQDSLFDLEAFAAEQVAALESGGSGRRVDWPHDPELPELRRRTGSVGEVVKDYAALLAEQGRMREAEVVNTLLYHLARANYASL